MNKHIDTKDIQPGMFITWGSANYAFKVESVFLGEKAVSVRLVMGSGEKIEFRSDGYVGIGIPYQSDSYGYFEVFDKYVDSIILIEE